MQNIETPDGTTVPIPDPQDAAGAQVKGWKEAGFFDELADAMLRNTFEALQWFASLAAQLLDIVLSALGQLFSAGQGLDKPAFYVMVASIMEDLLGVPFEAAPMISAQNKGGRVAAMNKVGEDLYTLLQTEFTQGGGISEAQGLKAAESFLGFLMGFSIAEGNIAVLSSLKYLPFAEGFREYGETMARNLGLGRLSRQALRPLIGTLIGTPLQWNLNRQYRPTKPAEATLVRAWKQGTLSDSDFQAEMERLGYTDAFIAIVKNENSFHLPDTAWDRAVRRGVITDEQAVNALRAEGLTVDEAKAKLNEVAWQRLDSKWSEYVAALEAAFVAGWLTLDRFQILLRDAPLNQGDRDLIVRVAQVKRQASYNWPTVGERRDLMFRGKIRPDEFEQSLADQGYPEPWGRLIAQLPGAEMTVSQYETAYYDGIVLLSDWKAKLQREGYTIDEQEFLTLQLLTNFNRKTGAAKTKGLTLAELRKAFKSGLISPDTLKQELKDLGYAPDVVKLYVTELTGVQG